MRTDDPGSELAPASARREVAPARRTRGPLAKVGLVGAGLVGVGVTATAMMGALGMILEHATETTGSLAGGSIVLAAFGAAGLVLARWAYRSMDAPAAAAPGVTPTLAFAIKQRMLAVASRFGGRITAAELAAMLGIEEAPAARALEAAAETGEARMLFSPEGIAVYEFPGLLAHKAEAKEPWEL